MNSEVFAVPPVRGQNGRRRNLADGGIEARRFAGESQVLEHQGGRQHRRGRFYNSHPHDIGRGAVHRFEVDVVRAVASAGARPSPPIIPAARRTGFAIQNRRRLPRGIYFGVMPPAITPKGHPPINCSYLISSLPGRSFLDDFAEQPIGLAQHVVLQHASELTFSAGTFSRFTASWQANSATRRVAPTVITLIG